MATVNGAGTSAVIPAGYYTSQGFQSLSTNQQAASTGQQDLVTSRLNLFNSLYNGGSSSGNTVLGIQVNGANGANDLAVNAGEADLQQSQSSLLSTLTSTSGWLPTSVFQLNLLQSLTRSGLLSYSQESPTASQAAATGAVDQVSDQQQLVNSLSDPSGEEGATAVSAYLSGIYNRTSQFSLVASGSNVGKSFSTSV